MMSQKFTSTKTELGKGSAHLVSIKAKYKMSGYCSGGCGLVWIKADGTCPSCGCTIIKKFRYDYYIKSFQAIIDRNKEFFSWPENEDSNIKIPVQMGGIFWFVPMKYFFEFERIRAVKLDTSKHKSFFNDIMQKCEAIKL